MIRKLCVGISCIFLCVLGLQKAVAQPKYNLKHYTTQDGLSHDRISCIIKDHEGFMWFGTWDGLNRFDGHTFVAYKGMPGDNSTLTNNKIRLITEDRLGYLWVKTFDNNFYRFDKKTERFLPINVYYNSAKKKGLVVDRVIPLSNGDTWLLTTTEGVVCAYADATSQDPPILEAYNKAAKGIYHLTNDKINFLFEDKQHAVWIGTDAGLTCLKKAASGNYQPVKFSNAPGNYAFTCITQHAGDIYLGTAQGLLFVYHPRSRKFDSVSIVPGININEVYYAKNSLLYLTTSGKGLVEYSPADHHIALRITDHKDLSKIYQDKWGLLWIQPERGVIKYDPANASYKLFTQKKDAEALTIHTTYQIFEDAYNVLWVCMVEGGFGYYNRAADEIEYFHDEPGSPKQEFSNVVTAIYNDPAGVLWFSGYDRGINKVVLQPDVFKQHLIKENAATKTVNEVRAIFEDSKGLLWIGNKAGDVYVYKNGIRQPYPFTNLPDAEQMKVYCFYETKDKSIWLGTKGKGLLQAKPVPGSIGRYTVTRYTHDAEDPGSINNNNIYTILQDHKGRIWIGTFGGGLNLLENNNGKISFKNFNNAFRNYAAANANGVRHLAEDTKGNIWIASTNGLVIYNPDNGVDVFRFKRYTKIPGDASSLGNNDVQHIYRDSAGIMWLGTFGGGLQKALPTNDPEKSLKFKVYTTNNGLPNDIILSIVADKQGRLWLATENGLSEFSPNTQVFKNYNSDDGLPQTPFSESAAMRSSSGDLYIGCINGYVSFDPMHVGSAKYTANMALTNLEVANRSIMPGTPGSLLKYNIDQTENIELKYNQNLLNIDYGVLDYKIEHKVWYAYKLEGYDKQWNMVKNLRQAIYTNVPPGNYVFKVKTVNDYLFKNKPFKSLAITILPPFWKTGWAYLVYFILVLILVEVARRIIITMIRLRNRVTVEQRLAELKLQFFTNISHELRTPLTLIVNPLEQIIKYEQLSKKGNEYINLANKNANRMVRFINQLLDFRKLQKGGLRLKIAEVNLVELIKHTIDYFTELAHEKQIDLTFEAAEPVINAWVDEEKIDIVVYNILANAFKFTPAHKHIKVIVKEAEGEIHIEVIDQGTGVPEEKLEHIFKLYYEGGNDQINQHKGTGIGLAFSRELINSHHGNISAANNPTGGMRFTICLKTGKEHFRADEADFVEKAAQNLPGKKMPAEILHDIPETIEEFNNQADKPLVLIVEDNIELRKFLGSQLSAHYHIEMAEDGAIGLQKAIDLVPDLIISDVMMPNMDGIAMLDAIKGHLSTSHIPVVLLTAKSSVEHQIEGMRYGADFYVTKPFNTEYVMALVENLLKSRKQLFNHLLGSKNLVQLSPGEILITSKDEQLLKQAIDIVEKNMGDAGFNIDDVAAAAGMGRTTFYKKIKSLTGLAPVEFVKEMRLKRSLQLMDTGEYNISEISYLVGFSSLGYFSTCFKEKYQQTPSQYLKALKEKAQ
jgi:signal transduction histidine kinase/ligand-binding sensor domain-containing protein/CheY-like chemotaxis protein/AraC-like DNA-binding protein